MVSTCPCQRLPCRHSLHEEKRHDALRYTHWVPRIMAIRGPQRHTGGQGCTTSLLVCRQSHEPWFLRSTSATARGCSSSRQTQSSATTLCSWSSRDRIRLVLGTLGGGYFTSLVNFEIFHITLSIPRSFEPVLAHRFLFW